MWTEETVRLVKQEFVALALDGRVANRHKDSEMEFLLTNKVLSDGARSATGYVGAITASGKNVARGSNPNSGLHKFLQEAVKVFRAMPPEERQPGALQVPERGPIDPKRQVAVAPPPGALIVRVYNRQLMHDEKAGYRFTARTDYIPALYDTKLGFVGIDQTERFREPSNDMMWVTKAEWQALMPASPRVGQLVKIPDSLGLRIFRFHLDPCRGIGEGQSFAGALASVGKLELTVEEVSSSVVRLRLEGTADLKDSRDYLKGYQSPNTLTHSQFTVGSKFGPAMSYKPRLLGYLVYHPGKKIFTRFDIVALGELRGRPTAENVMGERLGAENPLGIAFELVTDPKAADYLPPKGLLNGGGIYDLPRYLCAPKKS